MEEPEVLRQARYRMVREQIAGREIRDPRVLDAMRDIPRHYFVPRQYERRAYYDGPLPIGQGQTISQPYIVALMTQLLSLQGFERVLEIGTGSGYQAAILGCLSKKVFTVERYSELAIRARKALAACGIENVEVIIGDGSAGLPERAPFDAILMTAAAPLIPQPLTDQLAEAGRLVAPVGGEHGQVLKLIVKKKNRLVTRTLVPVAFVPLRGVHGWPDDEWRF